MCDLCGSEESVLVWNKIERDKAGTLRSITIPGHIHSINRMCKKCGLVFVEPKMTKEELSKFYAEDYRKIYGTNHSIEAEKRHANTALQIIGNELPNFDKNDCKIYYKNFLDIGCSMGELVNCMQTNLGEGDAYGIEPNAKHYEIAKSKGLNVENCSIEDYNPPIKFDIITMLNALEHVYSPTEVLEKINSLLNDYGYLLISTPNIYGRTVNVSTDVFLSNAHLYNFSIDTLTAYFYKCGFKVVKAYSVVEEIGEKIYLLGQKSQKVDLIPKIDEEAILKTKAHLNKADLVYNLKIQITQLGFN